MTFLSQLLALDKAATPGPWLDDGSGYGFNANTCGQHVVRVGSCFKTGGRAHLDMPLILALRNAAPQIAALIEAAHIALVALDVDPENRPPQWSREESHRRIDAALAALEQPK